LGIVQDKLFQKKAFEKVGIALPSFEDAPKMSRIHELGSKWGWPLVLKKRRNGYDGKGNVTLRHSNEVQAGWSQLNGRRNALYAEAFCAFEKELAIIVTRDLRGKCSVYPVVDTIQKDHICHWVMAPAKISNKIAVQATRVALKAVEAIQGVGTFGLELFLTRKGTVLVNEIAPRVHNSGHYTIEACECSQFENHVRAVMGWPLGSTEMRKPASVMVNLLGCGKGSGFPSKANEALKVDGAHLHLYGKNVSEKGRKMGHITVCASSVRKAFATARKAAKNLAIGKAPGPRRGPQNHE
jgi:5-(carboxyamino)imidazole ribonucleotide synthase